LATPSSIPHALTGDLAVDAATHGYYWILDQTRTVRWSISNGLSNESWGNKALAVSQLTSAFSTFSYYANINFQCAGSFASPQLASTLSDINVALDGANVFFSDQITQAVGFFPDSNSGIRAGDIFLNLNSAAASLPSYSPGSAGFALFLHEIGHALGLKHPHDDGGTGRPIFKDVGLSWLDTEAFSIMSYNETYPWNQISWSPASPMLLDVIGMQAIYGRNMSTNSGNSTYTLSQTNLYMTLWDAGGSDVVNAGTSDVGWNIALPDLQLSSIVSTKAGFARPIGVGEPKTLYWLTGDIENAVGSQYADSIDGSSLNNSIQGGGGNDYIDGGSGLDSALYSGRRSNYTITKTTSVVAINDRSGVDGIDTIVNVERALFSDASVAFDTAGHAGQAYRLYQAAFDRKPDVGGLGYWIYHIDNGMSLQDISWNFINSPEFKSLYGATQSNSVFVSKLYENILNRLGDSGGLNYWVGMLDRNEISRHYMVAEFSESAENQAQVVGSIQSGIEYIPFVA
jgi:hypothetical protein